MMETSVKDQVLFYLNGVNRPGVEELICWLEGSDFFTAPAARSHHGAYKGGLAEHSLGVFGGFLSLCSSAGVVVPAESAVIACLLHDLCKIGAYEEIDGGYRYNKHHPSGHARLSLESIEVFIALTALERDLILYHMGVYGVKEFTPALGEYSLIEWVTAKNLSPAVTLLHFADQMAAFSERESK